MRTIPVSTVTQRICQAVQEVNFTTPPGLLNRLKEIQEQESSPSGRLAMTDILENRIIAANQRLPMCQDTGMILVFVELGQEIHLTGGSLSEAICEGVRQGSKEGYLRNSVVSEPLFERRNSGDNTPPIIYYDLVPGNKLIITVAAKGFGAENMSRLIMLTPAQGLAEVKHRVVQCVADAGPNACPPVVVGVGVGGTMETAALLAKKALLRNMGQRHPEAGYAALEEELLRLVNATGVGPQGWGGKNTALDVRIEYYPTHIAGLPLAINLDCHLNRHIKFKMD